MHRFRPRKPRITPALVISMLALFVALTAPGIAQNVVPLAKRALTADKAKVATNAQRLQRRTAAAIAATPGPATDAATLNGQTAAAIAATPGPASSIPSGLLTVRSVGWSVENIGSKIDAQALCVSGERVVGGGFDMAPMARVLWNKPLADLSGWSFRADGGSEEFAPTSGSVWRDLREGFLA